MPKKRKYPLIIFIVIALALLAWAVFGAYGFIFADEINLKGVRQISADARLGQGVEYVFGPKDAETVFTAEQIERAREIFFLRTGGIRSAEYYSDAEKGTVTVILPSTGDSVTDVSRLSGEGAPFALKAVVADYTTDSDGHYVINEVKETIFDSEGIAAVRYASGTYSGTAYYSIYLDLTDEASAKLAEVTERIYAEAKAAAEAEAAAAETEDAETPEVSEEGEDAAEETPNVKDKTEVTVPEQCYFLTIDGEVYQRFTFTGKTEAKTLSLGSFTDTNTFSAVYTMLYIGPLPFEFEQKSVGYITPAYGDLLPALGIALAAAAVIGLVVLTCYARAAGFLTGLIWLAECSLYFIVYGICGRIYTLASVLTFAIFIVLSFAVAFIIMRKMKAEYEKGKTVEGSAVFVFEAVKPAVRTIGYGSAILGVLLLFFNNVCIDLGTIAITAGAAMLLGYIYVAKSSIISSQAFKCFRKPGLFKSSKEVKENV